MEIKLITDKKKYNRIQKKNGKCIKMIRQGHTSLWGGCSSGGRVGCLVIRRLHDKVTLSMTLNPKMNG